MPPLLPPAVGRVIPSLPPELRQVPGGGWWGCPGLGQGLRLSVWLVPARCLAPPVPRETHSPVWPCLQLRPSAPPSLLSLFLCLSVCLSLHPSTYSLSVSPSPYRPFSVLCISIHPSILSIPPTIHPSICLSGCLCPSIYPSLHPSLHPFVCLSLHLSIPLSIHLSICLFIHLSP